MSELENMDSQLLATNIKGAGSAVIILHGLFGSSDNLTRVALELAKEYRVFSMDLRNHGNSFHSQEMNYSLMVEDVKRCMDFHGIESAYFLGHSMGGKVAMLFALHYPQRVLKLIVADIAPVEYSPHHETILEALNAVPLDLVKNRKVADEYLKGYIEELGVRQFLLKSLDFSNNEVVKWKFNLRVISENYREILKGQDVDEQYEGKVMFIAGGNSEYIKPEHKDTILKLFPKAQLKIIPETGHWLHAEKPGVFIGICQRFIKEK